VLHAGLSLAQFQVVQYNEPNINKLQEKKQRLDSHLNVMDLLGKPCKYMHVTDSVRSRAFVFYKFIKHKNTIVKN
jgi:hypothetical protein